MSLLLIDSFEGDQGPPLEKIAAYARMLRGLFPPGRLWRFVASTLSALLEGCAIEMARLDDRVDDMLAEADPTTAVELLPEYERELALETADTDDERRGLIAAKLIQSAGFRPADFQAALAVLLAQDAADVVVIERTRAQVIAMGDDREIFRFFIYRDPALPGTAFIASAQDVVDEMAPSHTQGYVIESVSALYDDPHSLYDRDLLGV